MSTPALSNTDSKTADGNANGGNESELDQNKSASRSQEQDETADDSETSENDSESEDTEDEIKDDSSEESKDKPKKNGYKRKIGKLTAEKTAAERRALAAEAALLALKQPAAKTEPNEAKPTGKPNPDDFDTNAEYIDAVTDWKLEQRELKAKAEIEKESSAKAEKQRQSEFVSKVSEFVKANPDFEDVVEDCEVDLSKELQKQILDSDIAPKLMYELAKNPAEIERLNELSGSKLIKQLGILEDRYSKASESTKEIKTSKAPTPITPVGSKGSASHKTIFNAANQSEYESLRREQMKSKKAWG